MGGGREREKEKKEEGLHEGGWKSEKDEDLSSRNTGVSTFADVTVDHCDYVVDTVRRVRKFLNPFHALHATLFFRAVAKPFIMRPAGHGFPMLIQIASFLPLPFVVHS